MDPVTEAALRKILNYMRNKGILTIARKVKRLDGRSTRKEEMRNAVIWFEEKWHEDEEAIQIVKE